MTDPLGTILDAVLTRGDLAHLALLLWAGAASAAFFLVLREAAAASRRFDAFVRELSAFNRRHAPVPDDGDDR